jgi:DNA-binding HxlR family transcriptional regulator
MASARHPIAVTSRPRVDLCPVTETAKIIGKKWYLIILHELTRGAMGFNELKRAVRGISAKVLSENLGELEARALLTRTVYSDSPVRVEYALTDKGRELDGIFLSMRVWGERWAICAADEAPAATRARVPTDKELAAPTVVGLAPPPARRAERHG